MKCIRHLEFDAVSMCGRCGAGLCRECTNGSSYHMDNKPLCNKCNFEVGNEKARKLKSELKSKNIKMCILVITFSIGLISFLKSIVSDVGILGALANMFFIWGLAFIGKFFEGVPDNRSVKEQTKEAIKETIDEYENPVSSFIGKIIGLFLAFCIVGTTSPIQIIKLYNEINKTKRIIEKNDEILNGLGVQNNSSKNKDETNSNDADTHIKNNITDSDNSTISKKIFKFQTLFNILSIIILLVVLFKIIYYGLIDIELIKGSFLISITPSMNEINKNKNYCA